MYGNRPNKNPFVRDPFDKSPPQSISLQKRPPKPKKPLLGREDYLKAKELERQSGITFQQAVQVVRGKISLNDLLKRLLAQERLKRSPDVKQLTPSIQGQVAKGRMTVEQAKQIDRIIRHPAYRGKHSILEQTFDNKAEIAMHMFGREFKVGRIEKVEKYKILFSENATEPQLLDKVLIKFAYQFDLASKLQNAFSVEPEFADKTVEPIRKRAERPKLNMDVLMESFNKSSPVQLVTLEGDILSGRVEWFGKWEIGLKLESGESVAVFRHALKEIKT